MALRLPIAIFPVMVVKMILLLLLLLLLTVVVFNAETLEGIRLAF
jgi:hypothetical protein